MNFYRDGIEEEIDEAPRVRVTREGHTVEAYSINGVARFFVTINGSHFCAHGETLAEAIADAEWKDESKRPERNALVEQINKFGPERLITLNEFRLLTGACLEGCRVAMKRAGITETSMRAVDIRDRVSAEWGQKLLEILEAEND